MGQAPTPDAGTPSCDFELFRLVNPSSAWGCKFVAVNPDRSWILNLSPDHVSVQEVNEESNAILNQDYAATGKNLHFPISEIRGIVSRTFFESDFTLTYCRGGDRSASLDVTFGRFDRYYELEYFFREEGILKGAAGAFLTRDSDESKAVARFRVILSGLMGSTFPE